MPRKKENRQGEHILLTPQDSMDLIKKIVYADVSYKKKGLWELKYLYALSTLIERCNNSGKEHVPVSIRVDASKLGCRWCLFLLAQKLRWSR